MAHSPQQVLAKLKAVEEYLQLHGGYAVGFISYEAASGFDPALHTQSPESDFPLLWFGCFRDKVRCDLPSSTEHPQLGEWRSSIEEASYLETFDRIKTAIHKGDLYQTNFTFQMSTAFSGEPLALFRQMADRPAPYAAFLDIGRHQVCSQSPELFFQRKNGEILSKPMKGTRPRGLTLEQDQTQGRALQNSAKDRSENLMIVDMVRNDLGRVADLGSVSAESLFQLEAYPGLWQMTSSITAQTRVPVSKILQALFPCASVTGAPKVAAMKMIADIEASPRNLYTGAIGYFDASGDARFSVAIRTLVLDREQGRAVYGTGSGIVWESRGEDEYAECRLKVQSVLRPQPRFDLLETLLWTPGEGLFLLEYHLDRMASSAKYFQFPWPETSLREQLEQVTRKLPEKNHRLRLLLNREGKLSIECQMLDAVGTAPVRLAIANTVVDSENPFLYHKTTHRDPYQEALQGHDPNSDDVVLHNARGEVTETSIANLVIKTDHGLITPPLSCGLLPGTFRRWLLEQGEIKEGLILLDELENAKEIWLINSVRKWRPAVLVDQSQN